MPYIYTCLCITLNTTLYPYTFSINYISKKVFQTLEVNILRFLRFLKRLKLLIVFFFLFLKLNRVNLDFLLKILNI